MSPEASISIGAAAALACLHTILGIDHYVPFVAIGRARRWSLARTLGLTAVCGVGHVTASILIGSAGIAVGASLDLLGTFDATRGRWAVWLLVAFGSLMIVRAVWRAIRGRSHDHLHFHPDGTAHSHVHDHVGEHVHPHEETGRRLSPWALFVVLVLGPCEALIPLMMVPAAAGEWLTLTALVAVFALVTIASMVGAVAATWAGLGLASRRISLAAPHAEVAAGLAIVASGLAVVVLGV